MAKGNLFLGMGRGSVGDVTFYRADGQQLSRARNRKPRNPKSNAQLIQRAISATIVQAYKAGSVIFDHSFEGKSVPAGSQRAFLSTNMRKLRQQVLAEIESPMTVDETAASVVSPRSVYPVPNSYRISEGSLIQNVFRVASGEEDNLVVVPVAYEQTETVSAFFSRLNVVAGDIFTIVSFGVPAGSRSDLANPQCAFGFMRLKLKESALTSTTLMNAATFQDVFTIDSAGANLPADRNLEAGISIADLDIAGNGKGSIGVIRSNGSSGLRSSSDMFTIQEVVGSENEWGVASKNLLTAWSEDSGSVDSELILEGGQI